MNEFFTQYLAESLIVLGLILLTVEILVLGFSTFILFFLGISLIITGVAAWLSILPATFTSIFIANAILTSILAVSLWQPLKRIQNKTETKVVHNDFVGITFFAEDNIDKKGEYKYKYSGISWKVKSHEPISAGTEVEVTRADVGTFWVKPIR